MWDIFKIATGVVFGGVALLVILSVRDAFIADWEEREAARQREQSWEWQRNEQERRAVPAWCQARAAEARRRERTDERTEARRRRECVREILACAENRDISECRREIAW